MLKEAIERANRRIFPQICKFCNLERTLDEFGNKYEYLCVYCQKERQGKDFFYKTKDQIKRKIKAKSRPNYVIAHRKVKTSIIKKQIIKPQNCSSCLKPKKINAHHDDYLKPLEIRWLCSKCHINWHKINGEGLNKR